MRNQTPLKDSWLRIISMSLKRAFIIRWTTPDDRSRGQSGPSDVGIVRSTSLLLHVSSRGLRHPYSITTPIRRTTSRLTTLSLTVPL